MKRLIISVILGIVCLICVLSIASAKKRPIIERIEANIYPTPRDVPNGLVRIFIQDFSTDEELHDLAQVYADRGKDALESALGKFKKGYIQIPGRDDTQIELIRSESQGGVRRIAIIADRGQAFSSTMNMQIDQRGQEYPFIYVQLEFDQQGNAKGAMILYAKLAFNSAGQMDVKNFSPYGFNLVDVRSTK